MCDKCARCGFVETADQPDNYVDSLCEEFAVGKDVRANLMLVEHSGNWALCNGCTAKLFGKILALVKAEFGFPEDARLTNSPPETEESPDDSEK